MIVPILLTSAIAVALYASREDPSAVSASPVPPPLPAPPGLAAQVGDEVEVPLAAVPGGLIGLPAPPLGTIVTSLFVRVTNTQSMIAGDIRGTIRGFGYEAQGRSGSQSVQDGATTPYFSRLYVKRVVRNGQVIA